MPADLSISASRRSSAPRTSLLDLLERASLVLLTFPPRPSDCLSFLSGNFPREPSCLRASRASLGSETVTISCLMAELLVLFASSRAINVKTYGIMTLHCLPRSPLASMFIQLFLRCFVLLCDEAPCLSSRFFVFG